jgi:protocatechuate 3,4-dioxygenase beta subunit
MKFFLSVLSCLPLISIIEAQTHDPKPPVNCTVQGQIVQEPGGRPIKKAEVSLLGASGEERGETEYATATDAEGHFKFDDVKPGSYRMHFDHDGFVDAEKRHHGSGMLLSLEPAQQVKDLLFHMAPTAAITGKVTDSDGDPVPRVSVAAIPDGGTVPDVFRGLGSYTNDVGEYRIAGLPPKRYLVVAQPLSQLTRATVAKKVDKNVPTYGATYYPGTTEKSQASPVAVGPGDETPANIVLSLVHPAHVRGIVINLPAGRSDDVSLVLLPQGENSMAAVEPWPVDKDGKFDIRGVLPGSYDALFVFGDAKTPRFMRGDEIVQVTNVDVDGLRISPLANGVVRGQFRMDDGRKVDWSQFDISLHSKRTATIEAYASYSGISYDAFSWDQRSPRPEIKRNGSFEAKDVPSDTYDLRIGPTSKALDDFFVKAVNLGGKDVADSGLVVGGATYSLDVVVSAKGSSVEGVATDDKDGPASDVQVIFIPDQNRRGRHDLYQQVTTDSKGRFSLRGLNPGEYQVFVLDADVDRDEIADPEFVRIHESLGQTVKLEEGDHKSVVLKIAPSGD